MKDIQAKAYHPLQQQIAQGVVSCRIEPKGCYPLFRISFRDGYVADYLQSDVELLGDSKDYIQRLPVVADIKGDIFATSGIIKPR